MELSIIVPVYNCKDKILKLLENILTSNKEFEVLLINDGSSDESKDFLLSIYDDRVTVLDKENEGTFKTWQYGVRNASGEYIAILDQDDYVDKSFIDFAFSSIEQFDPDIICTPYYVEKEDGTKRYEKLPITDGYYCGESYNQIRDILLSGHFPYAKFSKIIRRNTLNELIQKTYSGYIFDFEDWLTSIHAFCLAKSVYICNKPYYHYIQYKQSVSKSKKSYRKNFESFCSVFSFLNSNLRSNFTDEQLDLIWFYGLRTIINKSIKIKELDLAQQLMCDKTFKKVIKLSKVGKAEKALLSISNARFYFFVAKIFRKV